jgi:hypothetical protein
VILKGVIMKKFLAVLLALLMVALTFASCTKPQVEGGITDDVPYSDKIGDTDKPVGTPSIDGSTDSDTDPAPNPDAGDNKEPDPTPDPDTGDNKDPDPTPNPDPTPDPDTGDDKDPEPTPNPDPFAPPTIASIYSGTPDTSWYNADAPQTEYVLTTADQLAGLNTIRQDSAGAVTFEGVTIKLGVDMIMNSGDMAAIVTNGDSNKAFPFVNSSYAFKGTFDGQGHTVSAVDVDANESGNRGIIGALCGNAVV